MNSYKKPNLGSDWNKNHNFSNRTESQSLTQSANTYAPAENIVLSLSTRFCPSMFTSSQKQSRRTRSHIDTNEVVVAAVDALDLDMTSSTSSSSIGDCGSGVDRR